MDLTKPQKLIYDMEKFIGGSISVICGSMLINGKYDITVLRNAVNELYRLNDALRIRIDENGADVQQYISNYEEQNIEVLHFADKAELNNYAQNYAKEPIILTGSLFDAKIVVLPEKVGILVKLHHLVGDAWTLSLIGNQFNAILNGEAVEAYSYADYIESEKTYLQSKRYGKDKDFFVDQFKKCDEVTYISEKKNKTYNANRSTFIIDAEKAKVINDYIASHETSAFMLFMSALATYINRTKMNAEKFYIGTAVLNRSNNVEKNTAGMFINTVPVLIELNNHFDFATNYSHIEESLFSILRHQKYNYGDILSALRSEHNFTEKLYDVILSYQNASMIDTGIETTWYHCGMQSESLQIHIDDRDNEGIYTIHYDYLVDKFTENEIARLHSHIINLLFDSIANDNKKLYELSILSDEEQKELLFDFNNTTVDYPKDKCVHTLFEEQAKKMPDKAAVLFNKQTLTYGELQSLINDYCKRLNALDVSSGNIVGVHLCRSYRLIAFQLAILKIGAVFLPVDKRYPMERIQYMCSDCDVKLIISDELTENIGKTNVVRLVDFENLSNAGIINEANNNDVCYIIYTSGSTGNPKGCMLTGKGLVNFCANNNTMQTLNQMDNPVFACVNSVSFDYFIAESLLPLTNGFTTVILDDDQGTIQEQFLSVVKENNINVVMTTPTRLNIYFDDNNNCSVLKQLECICTSGEPLTSELLEMMYAKSPIAKIYNPIGPSECSVWDIGGELNREDGLDIHIGKPIANAQIYIVDKHTNITPIGVTGELCIAGDGVGAGYLNRPELTAEKFIDNPFGEGKLYKTGDLAYWREDGNIVYVGRNDFQVKIRGLRIELGEIENAMLSVDGIHQAVVVVRKNDEGRQLICAFYTGEEKSAQEIKAVIGEKLPKYMLPHIFTRVNEIPLTSSGKINRKVLPEVDLENIESNTEYIAPETKMQKELCELIETILGVNTVGITDDFFDIGGDSLKAIEYVSKAHIEGIYFNLQNVFDYPTVKQLCECIENGDKEEISFADVDFSKVNKILAKNTIKNIAEPEKCDVGNILLAGATGYLGIHILANFLDNDCGIAYCLVRGKSQEDTENRLAELLSFYFGDKYVNSDRIKVVCADLQKDNFGLSQKAYNILLCKVQTVINCAASVKHYGSYKYFYEVNVETTQKLVEFSKYANAKLIHISTLSVSGNGFDNELVTTKKHFSESDLYIGQPLGNVYARSKFEAEKVLLEAKSNGLKANIMRMGNLTNRTSDGAFQKNYKSNAFLKRIKAMIELGKFPYSLSNLEIEFTAIDKSADAIMRIVRSFNDAQTIFHINNPNTIKLKDMFEFFGKFGYKIAPIADKDFDNCLSAISNEDILSAFINDMDEKDQLNYDSNIRIENQFTVEYLKKLGFEWSDIDIEYLRKYIEYFKKIGFLR